jgi:hypothetical protein
MTEMHIEGVAQLAALSKRLRDTGEKDLKRELNRSLRDASKKPIRLAKANAAERLPRKGGLAEKVATSRITQKNRLSAKNPTLAIQAANDVNLWRLDRGRIRHPVFGNRDKWVTQNITSGWWSDAMNEAAPEARRELAKALDRVQRKLEAPTHEFGSRGEFA